MKKYLIIILSLFLAFLNNSKETTIAKPLNKNVNNEINTNNSFNNKLLKDKNWANINNFWKKLNKIERMQDYNSTYKLFEDSEKELNQIKNNINNLKNIGLINDKEKEYLLTLFEQRLRYIEFSLGMVKCYKMSLLGSKIANTRGELEKRYDIIQKLFEENKINSDTFKTTTEQIKHDLKFIDENSGDQQYKTDSKLINLIIYLNK
ncbi:MAG: hypothetical protein AB1782_18975 [Cyanobacteriota bacterium]